MASVDECETALKELAEKLAEVDPVTRKRHALDRSLSCRVPDLKVTFTGQLSADGLQDLSHFGVDDLRPPQAQIRLTVASDDLLALCDGDLGIAGAWASGRLKIDASMLDVLRLRTII